MQLHHIIDCLCYKGHMFLVKRCFNFYPPCYDSTQFCVLILDNIAHSFYGIRNSNHWYNKLSLWYKIAQLWHKINFLYYKMNNRYSMHTKSPSLSLLVLHIEHICWFWDIRFIAKCYMKIQELLNLGLKKLEGGECGEKEIKVDSF